MKVPASLQWGWRAWLLVVVALVNVAWGALSNDVFWIAVGFALLVLAHIVQEVE